VSFVKWVRDSAALTLNRQEAEQTQNLVIFYKVATCSLRVCENPRGERGKLLGGELAD
jgi:hypothetical protein